MLITNGVDQSDLLAEMGTLVLTLNPDGTITVDGQRAKEPVMQIWVVMEEGCGDGNSPEQVFSSVEAAEAAASKGSRLYVCGPFTLDQ